MTITATRTADTVTDPNGPLDVWLQSETLYDDVTGEPYEETRAEANTYRNEDGSYRIEWYLNVVGLVTREYFDTYEECTAWYEREGFQDFSS